MRAALETANDPRNAQRLGYLWTAIGAEPLADATHAWLRGRATRMIWLDQPAVGTPPSEFVDPRWKVRVAHRLDLSL